MVVLDVDGTLTDGGVYISEEGVQSKKFHVHDGMGIRLMLESGIHVGIISHSRSHGMVNKRAEMLGIKHCYIGTKPKDIVLKGWADELGIALESIAYIGDDVNDITVMQMVGVSACPADALKQVKSIAKIVLKKKGGEGCVREFADEYVLSAT